MAPRFALVTIGQTPRTDLVPEILQHLPLGVEVEELGVLDGLSPHAIAEHGPTAGEPLLVTRLRDGSQVVLGKRWLQSRLQTLLDSLDPRRFAAVVLLCTGEFPGLRGAGLFLDAQHLVDFGVAALSPGAQRLGVLLPLAEQADTFHLRPGPGQEIRFSHASPYAEGRFEEAARELADADLIVMHCMGYSEAQRGVVAGVSGKPVLLARRLVATALVNLL